ncbi:MAG: hypothetical protein COZ80_06535, partial [Ignavibacteria bacterium CG_4_8_14_3_um_filter_37_9]
MDKIVVRIKQERLKTLNEENIPFQIIDWNNVETTEHKGEQGSAFWNTVQFPGLRIRIVTYS